MYKYVIYFNSVRYFFNFAYLLLGLGNVPMYTLTLSYIHENNYFGKVGTNHHYAWYHMNTAFGPGIGFLIAGQFTKTWVDFYDKVSAVFLSRSSIYFKIIPKYCNFKLLT